MILAIDIGGTQFRIAAVDDTGRIHKLVRRATQPKGGADWMIDQVLTVARELNKLYGFDAAGIGFGGPVDYDGQRIINSTHVAGWDNVRLPQILESETGIPALVDNDANVGALGEWAFGAGKGQSSIVYYTVSTGIGGGIVLNGAVYRGANGNAGELGHVPILIDGPRCACGNVGCLEALCSGPAIAARGRKEIRGFGKQMTAKDVFCLARCGNRVAVRIVRETADYLGMGIATTINTLAPDMVIVGGGVARAGKVLFDPLRVGVRRRVMPVHRSSVRIVRAKRGDRAVLLGAAAMALRF